MKRIHLLLLVGLIFFVSNCEKVSPDAVELSVQFSWDGFLLCGWGNPGIQIDNIPERTKFFKVNMYDHEFSYNHGTIEVPYTGSGNIEVNKYKKMMAPCPPGGGSPGRYEITVKAVDEEDVVIGIGSKERLFPEKE